MSRFGSSHDQKRQRTLSLDGTPKAVETACQAERVRVTGATKETLYKRVSTSGIQTRESSPTQEAALSRPESREEKANLLAATRLVFRPRTKLYSVDVHGRRSEIDTRQMGEDAYQALLEAFQNPVRYDGLPPENLGEVALTASREVLEGCKIGPETGLPLPEWWEIPATGASGEEIQAAIRRNLLRAKREGRGIFKNGRRQR